MYDLYVRSDRKETYMITPSPSHHFTYKSSWLWNEFRKIIGTLDFSSPVSAIKNLLTKSLLENQGRYGDEWSNLNFAGFSSWASSAASSFLCIVVVKHLLKHSEHPQFYLHLNLPFEISLMWHISMFAPPNQWSLSMKPPLHQKGLLISRLARTPNE